MSNYKLCTLVVFGTRPDATKLATVVQELGKQSDAFMVRSLLFAPIETARDNLLREGISDIKIMATGNTAIDALLTVIDLGKTPPRSGSPTPWPCTGDRPQSLRMDTNHATTMPAYEA